MKQKLTLIIIILLLTTKLSAQDNTHGMSKTYTFPKDENVLKTLDQWQDLKFGMIIHWGLYAELGVVESWIICSEEEDWIGRDSTANYDDYKHTYWNTINMFNPVNFNPEQWASSGRNAGMKYVVFTTKHHDGFCMFDTKQTDFSITNGAFKNHPRNNVAKEVFNAFRNENYMIGAYFSKPDWHSQYYWWDRYATPNRNNNYDIAKNEWRWNQFKDFTFRQIEELVNGDYGAIDILWLDGGWVRPAREGDAARLGRAYKGAQDIDMQKIASMARGYQPHMLIVDRTVAGEFENYQTPERGIPDKQLNNPWESCITLGNDWGFVPNDPYKSPAQIIHTLIEIVAKGGNLLLGIGPKPDGTLPDDVISRLEEIGKWMNKNGEAIYSTKTADFYNDGNTWFTKSKDGKKTYAIHCLEENQLIPEKIIWKGNLPEKAGKILFLETGKPVKWKITENGVEVVVPKKLPKNQPAITFVVN